MTCSIWSALAAKKSSVSQRLGRGAHALVQKHPSDLFRERRAARLARQNDFDAALLQKRAHGGDLRGLARAVYAFKGDEFSPCAHFFFPL